MEDPEVQAVLEEFKKSPRKMKDPILIDNNSKMYWKHIFEKMDEYSSIPDHKRENVLKSTLKDDELIYRLRNIYDVHKHPDIINYGDESLNEDNEPSVCRAKTAFVNSEYDPIGCNMAIKIPPAKKFRSSLSGIPESNSRMSLFLTKDYRKELTKGSIDGDQENQNMYMNFLNKPESKANRWRPKPPVTMKGMSLSAKCDAITKDIAKNFVDWMESLGGESKSTLDAQGVEALFEIGFNCHAADSLMVHVQELNAVTESVARSRKKPQASYSTQLYKQLYRDMSSVKSKEVNFAFGTMLPPEMRSGTTQDSSVSKWLENKRVPEKLATMAVVWEGIESLKSTEGYCNWLKEHEEITPPSYLLNKGLLEVKKKADLFGDKQKSLISMNTNILSSQSFRLNSLRTSKSD